MRTVAPSPERPPQGYIPTLDGWRAVAILLVIASHAYDSLVRAWQPARPAAWEMLFRFGGLGVQIFFGISGLLITSRLFEERQSRGSIGLRKFYLRRAFRILPPLLLLLACVGVLGLLGVIRVPLSEWLRALLFSTNYGPVPGWYTDHFWSLSVEEHFYIFWPLVIVLLGWRGAVAFALAASAAITLWRTADIHFSIVPVRFGRADWRSDTMMDCLLLGGVAGCLYGVPAWRASLRGIATWPACYGSLAALVAAAATLVLRPHLINGVRIILALVIPLVLLATVCRAESWAGRCLEARWLRWMGRLSYSLYLWQQVFFVRDADRSPALGRWQDWPWNAAAVLVIACLSYYLVERPLIKLGHRLARPATDGHADLGPAAGTTIL